MSRLLNIKQYSLNAKVTLSLFALALFLLTILFLIIVPKTEEEQYNRLLNEIEQVLNITQEQIKVAGKAIRMQSKLEIELNQKRIELELLNLKKNFELNNLTKQIQKNKTLKNSNFAIKTKDNLYISSNKEIYDDYNLKELDKWEIHKLKNLSKDYVYYQKYFFYTTKLNENTTITIFLNKANLNQNHNSFEKSIKTNIQKSFKTTQELHKGKTYLIWLNSKIKNDNSKPLCTEDTNERKKRYTLSNMSNVKKHLYRKLNSKTAL